MQNIQEIIDTCILLSQDRRSTLKRNFPLFPKIKQERIQNILTKTSQISFTLEELDNFGYGMKLWKNKKELQLLESNDI